MDLIKPQVGIRLLFMTHKNIFTSLEQPSHILKKKILIYTCTSNTYRKIRKHVLV